MADSQLVSTIKVPYNPPERDGKRPVDSGIRWTVDVDDSEMKERADFMLKLDPGLPPEDALWFVYDRWGGFLCRECGSTTVFDGQNGAGTTSVLCNKCERNMSVWNTYELTLWKYKKTVSALAHHKYGGSVEDISELLGAGKGALDEARTCLSDRICLASVIAPQVFVETRANFLL